MNLYIRKGRVIVPILMVLHFVSLAQERVIYKEVDTIKLSIEIYYPEKSHSTKKYPAIIFFFGGGWNNGNLKQFEPHAKYFSKRGMVCFLADYRVKNRHNSTPFESLKDAKSAIRHIREYSKKYNINPNNIVASGGSAGGHLAAAAALIDGYNEATDNLSVSCKPNALVLFNPAIDNGPAGVGYERVKEQFKDFSPLHNIKTGTPPTIIFLGTDDYLIPVETAKYYQAAMNKVGSRCELKLYEGKKHGFFNYNQIENYKNTVSEADNFMQSLGYLKKERDVEID